MSKVKSFQIFLLTLLIAVFFVYIPHSQAVVDLYWAAMPPYNTLWPLWSPALSPINPLTDLPTPIVGNLNPSTVLPVQPGLTWDPNLDYPWLLYNTPFGMAYYDPYTGVNSWPPSYLRDNFLGLPLPINLKPFNQFWLLSPTATSWLNPIVPIANNAYIASYPAYAVAYETLQGGTLANYPIFAALLNPPPPLQSLLTPASLLGLDILLP